MIKTFSSLLILLLPIALSAQSPTLVATDIPTAGQAFTFIEATYEEMPDGGMDQVWDVSGITQTGGGVQSWHAPSSSTAGASFPSATIVLNTGTNEQFIQFTSTASFILGSFTQGITVTCDDPLKRMQFPCTYGTSWSDTGTCSYTDQGIEYPSTTNTQFEADGYGTIILPSGPVTNVLRVVETTTSTSIAQGTSYVQSGVVKYYWKPGVPTYVASIASLSLSVDGFVITSDEEINYLAGNSIGMEDLMTNALGVSVNPNPASSQTFIDISAQGKLELQVFDMSGKCVKNIDLGTKAPGIHRYELEISDLARGIYTVLVYNERSERGSRRLVVE